MTFNPDQFDDEDDTDQSYLLEVTPERERPDLENAGDAMPAIMLERAMTVRELTAFEHDPSLIAVIKAPGAEWVVPLLDAAKAIGKWNMAMQGAPLERKAKDTIARDQAIRIVGQGGRVVGVSHNPRDCLPDGIAVSADMTINVMLPDDEVIRQTIRAATGQLPRKMPTDIALGLSFAEICFAIRKDTKPGECVARLVAIREARDVGADDLSKVPALEDLHGYGEAMLWARRLVADLDAWRRGGLEFSAIERTAVLASAPGLGKTTFVRSLAKTAGIPLIATSVSGWFADSNGHLDGVIKQIDKVFSMAAAQAPAIILLDEIEGIPNRATMDGRNTDWWMPVVGHMLLTLDSANSGVSSKLIVIGATNHPEKLDAALIRPGRLSRIINIERPDTLALAGILRQHLGDDLAGEDLSEIAGYGLGASGADVTEWVKGARSMARHAKRPVQLADLLAQVAPPDARPPEIDRRISVHEAGHAVVMQVLGIMEVLSVSAIAQDEGGGRVTVASQSGLISKADMEDFVTFLLAGRCAEESILGSPSTGSGGTINSDLARATRMVLANHASLGMGESLIYRGDPEDPRGMVPMDFRLLQAIEADLQRLHARAKAIVEEYREAVEAVTGALMRERFLSGERFREIFDLHPPGSKTIELDGRNG